MFKRLKSILVVGLMLIVTMSVVGCQSDDKAEVINEVTEANVDQITMEYKELLGQFQGLKANIDKLSKIKDNGGPEQDTQEIKTDIVTNRNNLQGTVIKFADLVEAKQVLMKAQKVVEDASDSAVEAPDKYDKEMVEYKTIFGEFNKLMNAARVKIETVRHDRDATSSDGQDKDIKGDKTSKDGKDKKDSKDKRDQASGDLGTTEDGTKLVGNASPQGSGDYMDKTSKLDDNLKKDLYNAGFNSGKEYRENGGEGDLDKVAGDMFDGLEGDNPIEKDKVPEAKKIFIDAFKAGYNA